MQLLYHNAIVELYLLDNIPRQDALKELGPELLNEVEYQRDMLKRDIEWGFQNAIDYLFEESTLYISQAFRRYTYNLINKLDNSS
ncbi:hypothetical protein GMMP15_1180003 [Candidatus Magnetomoraceae bacterium gMMP-15]